MSMVRKLDLIERGGQWFHSRWFYMVSRFFI